MARRSGMFCLDGPRLENHCPSQPHRNQNLLRIKTVQTVPLFSWSWARSQHTPCTKDLKVLCRYGLWQHAAAAALVVCTYCQHRRIKPQRRYRDNTGGAFHAGASLLTRDSDSLAAELGSETKAKLFWRALRQGLNPLAGEEKHFGARTVATIMSLDADGALHRLLNPDRIESLDLGSHSLLEGENAPDVFSQKEAGVRQNLQSGTTKFLLRLLDGAAVEAVLIPTVSTHERPGARQRTTLCVSSQVGCQRGCRFCRTATMGLIRNLTTDEILAQVVHGKRLARELGLPVLREICFMGMGEPLDNTHAVFEAVQILTDERRYGFSSARVTISTVGPSPEQLHVLGNMPCCCSWSLHAADDTLRRQLVPSRFPVTVLRDAFAEAAAARPIKTTRALKASIAATLIADVNDTREHARELGEFLSPVVQAANGLRAVLLNVIPYNDVGRNGFRRPTSQRVSEFIDVANASCPGLRVYVRQSRGDDRNAACGQLATTSNVFRK